MTNALSEQADMPTFYNIMGEQCHPAEAIERYIGDADIQGHPAVADDKQALDFLHG